MKVPLAAVVLCAAAWAQTPAITDGGVVNAATFQDGIAPGSIVSILGAYLANQMAAAHKVPWPTALDTVRSVTFNGVAGALEFVLPGRSTHRFLGASAAIPLARTASAVSRLSSVRLTRQHSGATHRGRCRSMRSQPVPIRPTRDRGRARTPLRWRRD